MNKSTVAKEIPLVNKKNTSPAKPVTKQPKFPGFGLCPACDNAYSRGKDECESCGYDLDLTLSEGTFAKLFAHAFGPPKIGSKMMGRDREYMFLFDESKGWFSLKENGNWKLSANKPFLLMEEKIQSLLNLHFPANSEADEKEVNARNYLWDRYDSFRKKAHSLNTTKKSLHTESDSWDRDPALIGTPAGMIELPTGGSHKSDWKYKITKSVSCNMDNNKDPDKWLEFLRRSTGENHELITFLQIVCGYCLTGLCSEEKLYFITGVPGTGKSTFIEVIKAIFNDYAMSVDINNLVGDSRDHLEWLANTAGKRLIIAREPEPGKKWKTDVLNGLISSDSMAARFMYKTHSTFCQ